MRKHHHSTEEPALIALASGGRTWQGASAVQVEVRHTSSCSSYFFPHLVGAPSGAVASSRVWHSISPCGPSGRRHHHTLVDRNSAISTATPQHAGEVETRRRSPLLQGNARSLSPLHDRGCSIEGCDSSIICEPQRVRSRRLGRHPGMVSQYRKPRCFILRAQICQAGNKCRFLQRSLGPTVYSLVSGPNSFDTSCLQSAFIHCSDSQ